MARLQRRLDGAQVGQELGGIAVRSLRLHRVAQRLGAGEIVQARRQARIHADQCAPVGFVAAVFAVIRRGLGQCQHRLAGRRQHLRHRQLGTQRVHLGEVEAQRRLGLARQRGAQGGGIDVRVAVAVAADPVAHAQERRHLVAGQRTLDVAVQLGDLRQEGARVVAERVFDLVADTQLGGAQHACLPQLGDARAQRVFVVGQRTLAVQFVAHADRFGDRPFGIEDAAPLHLGRVRGQHRRHVGLGQHRGDVGGVQLGRVQPLETHRQRAFLQSAGRFVVRAAAHVVAVLGDVGQVREIAEGADHAHRLVARQVLQQPVEHRAGAGVLLQPVGHRQLAHPLDELERGLAFLFMDHLAEDAAEQADVLDQRPVLQRRVARRRVGCRGGFFLNSPAGGLPTRCWGLAGHRRSPGSGWAIVARVHDGGRPRGARP